MEKSSLNNTASVGIIYHYPCYDGSYAALNAFLYYKNFGRLRVKFFPSNSHNRISEVDCTKFDRIYILDKGLNEDDLEYILKIQKENKNTLKLILIDHHLSSIEFYEKNYKNKFSILENIEIIFDSSNQRSASGLTFEYFKNKALNLGISTEQVENVYSENYKILNEYVEDSDIGEFGKKYSHEFKSGLSSYLTPLKSISNFNTGFKFLCKFYEVDVESCIRMGEVSYKKYKRNSIREISGRNCYIVELTSPLNPNEKWKFLACFTENRQYRNHACPVLSQISLNKGFSPIGAFVYFCEKDVFKMSMRSHLKEIDVGYICSLYGGGGHKSAAAFAQNQKFFDDIVISRIDLYNVVQYY